MDFGVTTRTFMRIDRLVHARVRVDESCDVVLRMDLVSSGKVMIARRRRGWTMNLVVMTRIPANLVLVRRFP